MTPIILFTGFLGAGKTTFIRDLIPALIASGHEPYVILNDYQNARVDALALQQVVRRVIPISGNCICCGSRDELFNSLETAPLNKQSVMLVEANGTADAIQLIQLISSDLRAVNYALPWQLSLIDAKRWQKRHFHNSLEVKQIETATHLYLSHIDECDCERLDFVTKDVKSHNPNAAWVTLKSFESEVIKLVNVAPNLSPRVLRSVKTHTRVDHDDRHGEAHHFASMELPLPDGLERVRLEEFLRTLPSEVVRAKGLLRLAEQKGEYTIFDFIGTDQSVKLRSHFGEPHVGSLFIAIGPRLPREKIRASLYHIAGISTVVL